MDVMPTAVVGQAIVSPVVGLTTEESAIVPAKLLTLVSETDTAATVVPELRFTGVPTEIAKSPTWTTVVVWWETTPGDPTPLMVTE